MAAAVSVAAASAHNAATISLTGHTATTAYVVQVVSKSGRVTNFNVTTNGSGAATVQFTPGLEDRGPLTVNVIPAATPSVASTTTGFSS